MMKSPTKLTMMDAQQGKLAVAQNGRKYMFVDCGGEENKSQACRSFFERNLWGGIILRFPLLERFLGIKIEKKKSLK